MRNDETREEYLARRRANYQANKYKWAEYRRTHREQINAYWRRRRAEGSVDYTAKKKWNEANREKIHQYQKKYADANKQKLHEYYMEHKEQVFKNAKASRDRYPNERKARDKVAHLIAKGVLVKQPCEICGSEKVDAHHDDYNKPEQVRWLCREHHKQWHSKNEPIRKASEETWLKENGIN